MRVPRYAPTLGAVALCGLLWPVLVRAEDNLELAFVKHAPQVVKALHGKGYRHVGVLKFLVTKDGSRFSDNVGTLNLTLAQRLEVALVLANGPRETLGVLRDASAVAARTPGANHLTPEGRLKLFAAEYPLAWGKQTVRADALVTGLVQVSGDLRTLRVSLLAFGRDDNKLTPILPDFTAANRADQLGEMGESFALRGAFGEGGVGPATDVGEKPQQQALGTAARVKAGEAKNPLEGPDAPVKLEVRYDGQIVDLAFKDGKAFIPEPREGQKVQLVLRRGTARERLGIVLKVNGVNTLRQQRLPDPLCRKWTLDPGVNTCAVDGFQLDNEQALAFRILSRAESKANEIAYGADVGTITLTVFRERRGPAPPLPLANQEVDAGVVEKARLADYQAQSYDALKAQLLDGANRGLIGEGNRIGSVTETVRFAADPVPVMSATVTYYRP